MEPALFRRSLFCSHPAAPPLPPPDPNLQSLPLLIVETSGYSTCPIQLRTLRLEGGGGDRRQFKGYSERYPARPVVVYQSRGTNFTHLCL